MSQVKGIPIEEFWPKMESGLSGQPSVCGWIDDIRNNDTRRESIKQSQPNVNIDMNGFNVHQRV
jgi:hypothetical protein